jgi:hypothetical protein
VAYFPLDVPCTAAQARLRAVMSHEPQDARDISEKLGFGRDGTLKVRTMHGNIHKRAQRVGAPDPILSERRRAPDGTEQTYLWLRPLASA